MTKSGIRRSDASIIKIIAFILVQCKAIQMSRKLSNKIEIKTDEINSILIG